MPLPSDCVFKLSLEGETDSRQCVACASGLVGSEVAHIAVRGEGCNASGINDDEDEQWLALGRRRALGRVDAAEGGGGRL